MEIEARKAVLRHSLKSTRLGLNHQGYFPEKKAEYQTFLPNFSIAAQGFSCSSQSIWSHLILKRVGSLKTEGRFFMDQTFLNSP